LFLVESNLEKITSSNLSSIIDYEFVVSARGADSGLAGFSKRNQSAIIAGKERINELI
jgi:hypothetical protein